MAPRGIVTPTLIDSRQLAALMPAYEEYLRSEGAEWLAEQQRERDRRRVFFAEHFTLDSIDDLDDGAIHEMVHLLGAFSSWNNRDWLAGEILKSGLPAIQDAFWQLLYGDDLLESRFDFVKERIRMMGSAAISELLAYHDPGIYPIWSRRSRPGLILLGVDERLLPKSAQISGAQYMGYSRVMQYVLEDIRPAYPQFADLLALDPLLRYLALENARSENPVPAWNWEASADFNHNEVIDQLLQLGDGLGFEVDKEVAIAPGCRLDAIWRTRVANLGTIAYGFEVHRRGSRDSALVNLQRVSADPAIQKVVIVATREEIEVFRREIASLPEAFRRSAGYLEVQELRRALEHLSTLKGTLNTLGLLGASRLFD